MTGPEEALRAAGLLSAGTAVALAWSTPATGPRTWCSGRLAGRPVDPATPFYVASVTKQLVGVLAAQQVGAGRLDPDVPVRSLLPRLPAWAADVGVRHLLHHTSGLPGTDRVLMAAGVGEAELTNADVLDALAALDGPEAPPGRAFAYSNVGYVVLAEALVALTATELPVLARRQVLAPLGLAGGLGPGPAGTPSGRRPPRTLGDGGWWTGAADLLRWLEALDAGRLGADVSARVRTPGRLDDGRPLTYGWGVTVHADGTLTHGGSWPGWTAKTVRHPATRTALALLTTSDDADAVSRVALALHAQLVAGASSQASSRSSSVRRPDAP
ncbi:serine hydrolase domain-containing protein [Microlunatus capsulatus]|uniref:CubicO group peptidase (Beta-lactamase class C family) n=1 Tax=Microlunatus capsulatus TaxID=99117 RepID=A0ABS4Z2K9_9ACTN|nr:serine hydrolase domain-containing protein [Microlunatus capsulatus]MBP2415219.1 CubicO group peptidase (beta-lactamase class C family) [Microlunatus capsulatus]